MAKTAADVMRAIQFAKSLARGTPGRMNVATTVAEGRVRELV